MGINFNYGDVPQWSGYGYKGFKIDLCRSLGIKGKDLEEGFEVFLINEPIFPLINSGESGSFSPEELEQMLPQLKEIINSWDYEMINKTRGLKLIEAFELAVQDNSTITFR